MSDLPIAIMTRSLDERQHHADLFNERLEKWIAGQKSPRIITASQVDEWSSGGGLECFKARAKRKNLQFRENKLCGIVSYSIFL